MFKIYNSLLIEHPIKTKSITSCFLFGFGDVLTQFCLEKKKIAEFEIQRFINLSLFGLVYTGPILHYWFNKALGPATEFILVKGLRLTKITDRQRIIASVFIDQSFFASFFMISFFGFMGIIEQKSVEKGLQVAKNSCDEKFYEGMIANWTLWPAAQAVNFSIVPIQFRVLYCNAVGLFWNMYLSSLNSKNDKEKSSQQIIQN